MIYRADQHRCSHETNVLYRINEITTVQYTSISRHSLVGCERRVKWGREAPIFIYRLNEMSEDHLKGVTADERIKSDNYMTLVRVYTIREKNIDPVETLIVPFDICS